MQSGKAVTKYVKISPRKARLAAALIRGKKVEEAELLLKHCRMKGGKLISKTLMSAVANAETQKGVQRRDLAVGEVRVDCGPTLKRAKSKNRGGRAPILKRTSHFSIEVTTV